VYLMLYKQSLLQAGRCHYTSSDNLTDARRFPGIILEACPDRLCGNYSARPKSALRSTTDRLRSLLKQQIDPVPINELPAVVSHNFLDLRNTLGAVAFDLGISVAK
jgi:hypothetical protein